MGIKKKRLRRAVVDLLERVEALEEAIFEDDSEENFDIDNFLPIFFAQNADKIIDSKIEKLSSEMSKEEFGQNIELKIMPISENIKGLNAAAFQIHLNAMEHGWYDEPRTFGDVIALCHSELSEALEAFRGNEETFYMESDKPEGVGVELVDCIIRILDYMASEGMDIERILALKHEYNVNRPYRHGGKAI